MDHTLFGELNRIHSHLIFLGTSGVELGAISLFFYCLRGATGARPVRDGDRSADATIPAVRRRFGTRVPGRAVLRGLPRRIDEYLDLVAGNSVWRDRYRGIG